MCRDEGLENTAQLGNVETAAPQKARPVSPRAGGAEGRQLLHGSDVDQDDEC